MISDPVSGLLFRQKLDKKTGILLAALLMTVKICVNNCVRFSTQKWTGESILSSRTAV